MPEYEGVEYEGIDALLAAITDEPLPEGALDDAEFMTEHRSASADVALLREQLRIMGDTLAAVTPAAGSERSASEPAPAPAPAPSRSPKPVRPSQPPWYRRYAGVALGTLVVAAGTAMLGGLMWLGVQGSADSDVSSDSGAGAAQHESTGKTSLSLPEMRLACSKVLVEGTVRSITPTADGNVRVVLKVKHYYRPEQSVKDHPTITVTLPERAREDLKVGTYALLRVPVHPQDRQDWETGPGVGDARKEILEALPGARGMECEGPSGGPG